jgi:hypothetical protein
MNMRVDIMKFQEMEKIRMVRGTFICIAAMFVLSVFGEENVAKSQQSEKFHALENAAWEEVLFDPCTDEWSDQWFLDGERATVRSTEKGMFFSGGPIVNDSSCHAVLWTKESFSGDIKIEYEYTRMDSEKDAGVNILYILA